MSLARNEQALIDLVTGDARMRRDQALTQARDEARRLLRDARAEARRNAARAFADARHRGDERIAAARAMLETRRRLAKQRRNAALLAACWQALPDALVARWNDDATRVPWVTRTFDDAVHALPRGRWRVAHAAGWPAGERQAMAARIHGATGEMPDIEEVPALRAGLAVAADGTSIDATLEALLADRADIGALLLQHLDADAHEDAR